MTETRSADLLALSVRQPYAWLIAAGLKPVENRDCKGGGTPSVISQARMHVGERIAIHASQTGADIWSVTAAVRDAALQFRLATEGAAEMAEQCGHVIATAVIDRVINHGDGDPLNAHPTRSRDRFAIVLSDVRKLRQPVPCKGALGLWRVPPDVAAQMQTMEDSDAA